MWNKILGSIVILLFCSCTISNGCQAALPRGCHLLPLDPSLCHFLYLSHISNVRGHDRGGNRSFSDEVCLLDKHQVSNTSNHRGLTRQYESSLHMMLLAYRAFKYDTLRSCQRSLKLNYKSARSGGCALWITLEQLLFKSLLYLIEKCNFLSFPLYYFSAPEHGIWGESNDYDNCYRIGQELVGLLSLREPVNDCSSPSETMLRIVGKGSLLAVQHMFSVWPPSDFAKMCWEPEIQEAERLYDAPGKWDVDEKCVSTLQTISVRVLAYIATFAFLPPSGVSRSGIDKLVHLVLSLYEIPDVSEHIHLFLNENSDVFLQAFWYPPFKRFLSYARQRSQDDSSVVSVSCKGLQGSRDEVYNTTLQLLRLIIVNEVRYQKFAFARTLFCVTLSNFLPCLLHVAL